jgi:hypothetical protein
LLLQKQVVDLKHKKLIILLNIKKYLIFDYLQGNEEQKAAEESIENTWSDFFEV